MNLRSAVITGGPSTGSFAPIAMNDSPFQALLHQSRAFLESAAPGAELSRKARDWWKSAWRGESFMAIGTKDPVLGPPVMRALRNVIRNCPEPYVHAEGGHFLQEWGEDVAARALASWR